VSHRRSGDHHCTRNERPNFRDEFHDRLSGLFIIAR
jgi:hypothetical protein